MTKKWVQASAAVLFALTIAGCGGGGGGETPTGGGTGTGPSPLNQTIATAAGVAANDTSINSNSSFAVVQQAGIPAVSVASGAPKVNFAVFSNGQAKSDVKLADVSFAIAKLVPGTNGSPDQWVNYVYRTETATPTVGPNGHAVLASAKQATTDSKQTDPALAAQQLVYNPEGYYTYTFKTDIKNPAQTNGVVFEPGRTHRIAVQLAYTNAAGEPVRVNPYFDFTFDAAGNSVPVDAARSKKVADINNCNGCHEKLALHGGGRVDVQYCVLCHNPGTTDANSGNVLTLSTMVHKIHAGKLLKAKLDQGKGGEEYVIWGYQNTKVDFAEVGFPQDLRNCTVCHTAANPNTPQGDNWKSKPSREACLTCHAANPGSDWYNVHFVLNSNRDPNAAATQMPNSACAGCHAAGTAISPERVHWNQNEENAAKYKMNIESATYDAAARVVNVRYFVSDPTAGNAPYNLVTSDCTGTGASLTCSSNTKFGNLRFYLAYPNMAGQPLAVTEFTSYNNGGSGANAYAYKGTNDGSNHYTVAIPVPADVAGVSIAQGTGRVVSIGQIKEPKLEVKAATDPRPVATPAELVNVVAQHTYADVALSGPLTPRRQIVSNEKCNVCHGALGTTSGSNTLANAFHGGARNTVEACVVCHDPNRMSSTVMTNGLALNESYQFKRFIHGIHGNSKRTYPFTHGNVVQGPFDDTGKLLAQGTFLANQSVTINGTSTVVVTAGTPVAAGNTFQTIADIVTAAARARGYTGAAVAAAENYGAEVAYPQVGLNCDSCHVNKSYQIDRGQIGAVVAKPAGATNPLDWLVISPKAASCTACHDSPKAIGHVTSFGNAAFGDRTQRQSLQTQETCMDCHAPGVFKGVDIVHGQK
ncbi:OmcA/MtrC family decaheme c-type cytochrome [Ramlibacter sp.]|uniref:OmcA/MtrC family decaheme c-type cytochrome n=1 Tax=Ramlibacter sp. TaxID=1917967 RepID=UPI002BC80164|nr:OmcA/MtrC family decaheme c-type cytochrome [Ramlibacter sp.]HWI83773.1 OmcA/MtrC family decaheme c-type cytochrome [Ramlibacter sp.]